MYLSKDENGNITLDGQDEITFFKREYAIHTKGTDPYKITIQNFTYVRAGKRFINRIRDCWMLWKWLKRDK